MPTPSLDTLDIISPDHYQQNGYPHEEWALLRREAPIYCYTRTPGVPFWALTKYYDIIAGSKQPRRLLNSPRLRARILKERRRHMKFALSDLRVSSPAFEEAGRIPAKHTGEGEDTSPPLEWSAVPDGTRSFAVICHDPDAPVVSSGGYGFVHWVLYNIPGSATNLPEGVGHHTTGPSDFGKPGYGGPMPPNGHGTHRYFFWVLALGRAPDLEPGLTLRQLLETIESDVIGMNRLMGTYERA